ncbi:hypothetical protein GCM10023189_48090 [Nibrella saemangeumensis]|uniref:Transposase n=1 Tax=Nibrella saemangeumensis TaxID=1084526 RepID=A0ABP8NI94_9BACT
MLHKNLDYSQRSLVFYKLDKLGYYGEERDRNIFNDDRLKLTFQSHLADYFKLKSIQYFPERASRIGVFFKHEVGFYHFWSAFQYNSSGKVDMHYIRYKRKYALLKNARKDWKYEYILTDDLKLLADQLPEKAIDTIYGSENLALVKLKTPQNSLYLY